MIIDVIENGLKLNSDVLHKKCNRQKCDQNLKNSSNIRGLNHSSKFLDLRYWSSYLVNHYNFTG